MYPFVANYPPVPYASVDHVAPYSPSAYSPIAYPPSTYSPSTQSPSTYSQTTYSPNAYLMPGTTKRVHFDLPPTPSPTLSHSSLASSAGPSTPPQYPLAPHYSPPAHPYPLYAPESPAAHPSSPGAVVHLHGALLPSPHPVFAWDMATPPSTAHIPGFPAPLPPALLAEPATHPPRPALTLVCALLP
ncbi:hypothetical protein WOLCODRAFT_155678, partial [Wolfiporia cocos MD-104 SS10]